MIIFRDVFGKKLINLRDIGGLKTSDGKRVVCGRLFRGGKLYDLPKRSVETLKKLGIKTIIDLRTLTEAHDHPDTEIDGVKRLELPTITTVTDAMNEEKTMRLTMKRESKRLNIEFDSAEDYMMETYRSIMNNDEPKSSLRAFIQTVVKADAPLMWHCTSGKDRTGICAMLLESLLGVEEGEMLSDYLYSNRRLFRRNVFYAFMLTIAPMKRKFKKILIGYLGVKKRYFMNIREELKTRYGGVVEYCKAELGVTDEDISVLRGKYLTAE